LAGHLQRLLIIEDNEADVYLIKRALHHHQISAQVTVCNDGEAAVQFLASAEMETPDAIILDLALPRVEGLEVLRQILSSPALVGTPIMIFTSSPAPADKHRAELLSRARYVQKPSGIDSFFREVGENVKAMLSTNA
jgi:CheY-like chemotaxis protein